MPFFCASYVAGVIAVAFSAQLPSVFHLTIIVLLSLIALGSGFYQQTRYFYQSLSILMKAIGVFSLSFTLAALHGHLLLQAQYDDQLHARDCQLAGVVTGLPKSAANYQRFDFVVHSASCEQSAIALSKVTLSIYHSKQSIQAGDRLEVLARLKAVRPQYSAGAFDAKLWAINRGINASGYIREVVTIEPQFSALSGFRQRLVKQIRALEISGLAKMSLQALVLGDKSAIKEQHWQQLQASGTVHLLVVSGLHIGIMVAIGWWFCFVLRGLLLFIPGVKGKTYQWIMSALPSLGALSLSFSYMLLSGASLSTQRAWLMALVMIGGAFISIKPNLWQRWWIALLIIITWQPLSVMQPGLWLSFLAVAGLISLQGFRSNSGVLLLVIKSQFWVWLALFPLLLLFFGQVSLISPLVNVFAISFISLLLFALLPAALIFYLGWIGPLAVIAKALDYFWWILAKIAEHGDVLLLEVSVPSAINIVLIGLGCWCLLLPFPREIKALGLLTWLLIIGRQGSDFDKDMRFKATLINVGQGLSVLVQTPKHTMLFDTGAAFDSGFSYFKQVVSPLLAQRKIDKLDLLVISHADNDHSGGLLPATQSLTIDKIEMGMPSKEHPQGCQSGRQWLWDEVSFHYRHPIQGMFSKRNNRSCVLELGNAQCKVLIMADAEKKVERMLLASVFNAEQRLLIVGHHGSNTSSTEDFLSRERFSNALISNGYRNRYGHPHPKVIERLKSQGIKIFRTDQLGTIDITASDKGCEITSHKSRYRRYWW
jgi:competence protein ComEC